ncbi:MAG: HIT family protein [Acidimicrobiia bacterium]
MRQGPTKAGGDAADGCAFCAIVTEAAEAAVVLRSDLVVAFLDRRPVFAGHCLVVPTRHHETLLDLPEELLLPLLRATRTVAAALESGLGAQGTFVAVNNRVSQSVAHLHVHVVPRKHGDGLRGFFWPRTGYRDEAEVEQMAETIRRAIGAGRS